jgi:deoxyribose-phosphate aldolase
MKIEFEKRGGFAGLTLKTILDTQDLTPEEKNKVISLIKESNFFELKQSTFSSKERGGADLFKYKIAVKDEEGANIIETTDTMLDETLRSLVSFLSYKALKEKSRK